MDDQTNNTPTTENSTDLTTSQPSSGRSSQEKSPIKPDNRPQLTDSSGQNNRLKSSQIKKYFLYIMIGGLILSAAISIMAVLVGQFNDFMQKSLFTTLSIVVHSLIALAFVSINVEHHTKADETIIDTLFGITIASFATSVLALWGVLAGPIIGHLYLLYLYALIAAALCRALLQASRIDNKTRMLANASIIITILLFLLLMPNVFVNTPSALPDIYYRGVAATAILLGTTSVLTAILHRLYINKHPEVHTDETVKKHSSTPVKIVVLVLVLLFVVFPAISMIIIYAMR